MSYTAIVISTLAVLLVVLVIVFNIVQQAKEKKESERRAEVTRQKAIIEETEDLIAQGAKIPLSRDTMLMLANRSLNAHRAIKQVAPGMMDIEQRIKDCEQQVTHIQQGFVPIDESRFRYPSNEKVALGMVQALKKLRLILRAEHNKGQIGPGVYTQEENAIDRMQLKINLENLINRALSAFHLRQWGSTKQLLDKAEQTILSQLTSDEYVEQKREQIADIRGQLNEKVAEATNEDIEKQREKHHQDDLDELFQPKKKW